MGELEGRGGSGAGEVLSEVPSPPDGSRTPTLLGFVSDVHGNAPALDAVLSALRELAVDDLRSAGDLVGYNVNAAEVVERFVRERIPSVAGNHDRMAAHPHTRVGNDLVLGTLEISDRFLRSHHIDYLAALPAELREERCGRRLLVVHGTPDDPLGGYLFPDQHDDFSLPEGVDVLVVGQTHRQLGAAWGGGLVVNPGTVGLPRDGDPRPSFAVVDMETLSVDHHRVLYDCSPLAIRNAECGIPAAVNDRLFLGGKTEVHVALDAPGSEAFDAAADRLRGEGRGVVRNVAGMWVEIGNALTGVTPAMIMIEVVDDSDRSIVVRSTPVRTDRPRDPSGGAGMFTSRSGPDGTVLELHVGGSERDLTAARLVGLVEAAENTLRGVNR